MKAAGLRVPRARGEELRRRLRDLSELRGDRKILKEGEFLVFPIAERSPLPAEWGEVVQREFPAVRAPAPSDYRDLLDWTPEARAELPRAFDVVGDVVLVRLPGPLESRKEEVGRALLAFVPSARIVGLDRGVRGPERRRQVERIAGTGGWRTRHRENGLDLEVDVERAYFSPRLAREHERVAADVREGERVYDLCCGVGPFALTLARDGRASRITAVDSNPDAISMLRTTRARYPWGRRIEVVEAPIERFLLRAEPVDRVILNLPHEGIKYLPSVAPTIAPHGRLHYYEVAPRAELERRAEAVVSALGSGTWGLVDRHLVHPYSPTAELVAFVVERRER
jgi:tRNA (guanine37-N1)-methyltransferase